MLKIYLICPVRNASEEQLAAMKAYVMRLENDGHEVHYPPRDVDQKNDDGGVRICKEHREAMAGCDEVHVWWDKASTGSHFDLGMAFMLNTCRVAMGKAPMPIRTARAVHTLMEKSFQNVLVAMCHETTKRESQGKAAMLEPAVLEVRRGPNFQAPPRATPELLTRVLEGFKQNDDDACQGRPGCKNRQGDGYFNGNVCGPCLMADSGEAFLRHLEDIGEEDAAGLRKAYESYGNSWKSRGGVGAFMMFARKWDRMENRVKKMGYDIFRAVVEDTRGEGVMDDIRDLRRYLALAEAEMRARGYKRVHRDNKQNA